MRLKLSERGEEYELPGALLSSFLCSKLSRRGCIVPPQARPQKHRLSMKVSELSAGAHLEKLQG